MCCSETGCTHGFVCEARIVAGPLVKKALWMACRKAQAPQQWWLVSVAPAGGRLPGVLGRQMQRGRWGRRHVCGG